MASPAAFLNLAEIGIITLCAQAFAISVYAVALAGFGATADILMILSAAAVVSFAASIPISINGWGVRELASVTVFPLVGIDTDTALAASILVGVCSTAMVLLSAPALAIPRGSRSATDRLAAQPRGSLILGYDQIAGLALGLGTACLLFFQFPLTLFGSEVTVNLADGVSLLALGLIAAGQFTAGRMIQRLPLPALIWLCAITIVLLLSFAIGVSRFGVTGWALNNRIIGWLIVLGYVACGTLLVGHFRLHGLRQMLVVLALTAVSICIVRIGFDLVAYYKLIQVSYRQFDGFSANRNAFAFQLLVATIGAVAVLPQLQRGRQLIAWSGVIGVLFLGQWLTGSRTGVATLLLFLALWTILVPAYRKGLVLSLAVAALSAVFLQALPYMIRDIVNLFGTSAKSESWVVLQGMESLAESAVTERLASLRLGLELWLSNPIFGAGLGAAIRENAGNNGGPLVIHNTLLWVLAELGLPGLFVVCSLPAWLIWRQRKTLFAIALTRHLSTVQATAIGLVLAFAMFGMAHDIAYQRIFWLVLGGLLVLVPGTPTTTRQH